LNVGPAAGDYTEIFTAEPCRLAATAELELSPWAFKVFVTGTPQPTAKTP
jgi:hypothetical protein